MNWLWVALGACGILILWIMIFDSNRFIVTSHTIIDSRIKKPVRACVLSDLHNKQYGRKNVLLLDKVKSLKPDVIFISGDLLTAKPGKTLQVFEDMLCSLREIAPVYFGYGNHEHRLLLQPQLYGAMGEEMEAILKKHSIITLMNEGREIENSGIFVSGAVIDCCYYKKYHVFPMESTYMNSILDKPDRSFYQVLLAHNPDYFLQYAEWGADLIFSGHVHGGIVKIPFWKRGIAHPGVRLFPKYHGGLYKEGQGKMIVSNGLGMHTLPFRLFNPGELITIEFAKGE